MDEVDDSTRTEEAAELENTAIDAMMTLVTEHGYDENDLTNMVRSALDA